MYNPPAPTAAEIAAGFTDKELFEYIEIKNTGVGTVNLANVRLVDGITFNFAAGSVATLAPGEFVVVVRNQAAFAARYGTGIKVAGAFTGALSNSGERIALEHGVGVTVEAVEYGDSGDWPGRADGNGSSLERIDTAVDVADPANWRNSTEYGGSPGREGLAPMIDVVVNEVLANPGTGALDAIELYNTTEQAIDVGGWYLSDSSGNYRKFAIPAGTILPAGGYLAFDESDFNVSGGVGPNDFGLSGSHGDDVWLLETDAEGLTRFADHVEFGATAEGESYGRWPDGGVLYPMSEPTLGAANAGVRIGPVIVSEVQYHPSGEEGWLEYVELYNATDAAVNLGGWRLRDGIEYDFPQGTSIAAHATLLVVPFNPTDTQTRLAFEAFYQLTGSVALVGPYIGLLDNVGESVALFRPGTPPPDEPSFTPYLLVDAVTYDDASPWPTAADGNGSSLARRSDRSLGSSADGWIAAAPSPGEFAPQTAVLGSYVFYRGSTFDNPAKGRTEDDADRDGQEAAFARRNGHAGQLHELQPRHQRDHDRRHRPGRGRDA